MTPFVSVIIPTTHERIEHNKSILNQMISQDYKAVEILWDFEEGTIGAKRNRLCARAHGEIILHADSDDYYAKDWVSRSVKFLIENKVSVTGLRKVHFYNVEHNELFLYSYPDEKTQWVCGASLCYRKEFWEKCNFPNIQIGEDAQFVAGRWNGTEVVIPTLLAHDYVEGFCASIHSGNTSVRNTSTAWWLRMSTEEGERVRERFGINSFAAGVSRSE